MQDMIIIDGSLKTSLNSLADIDVMGNNISIPDGDSTASLADHTEFGNTNLSVIRTFTIKNTSAVNLKVDSIYTTGNDLAMFTVGGITFPTIIAANRSATFRVNFVPRSSGLKKARINIINNDCDESLYDFSVQGFVRIFLRIIYGWV